VFSAEVGKTKSYFKIVYPLVINKKLRPLSKQSRSSVWKSYSLYQKALSARLPQHPKAKQAGKIIQTPENLKAGHPCGC
jgi:hypothetical protein